MELNTINNNMFSNLIPKLLETGSSYDNNIFQNIDEFYQANDNVFSNLNKLFNDEHDKIFNDYMENEKIFNFSTKIEKDLNELNYDSEKFLNDLDNEINEKNNEIITILNEKINVDINTFNDNIDKIRIYYKNINVKTFQLEENIINILKKYDEYKSNMEIINKNLNNFNEIDKHLDNINKELMNYMLKYFEKENLKEKIKNYKNNITEINIIKKYLNKLNGLTFVPYCQICMTTIIDRVVIPCGHTFCNTCLLKNEDLEIKRCFICRDDIHNVNKLFIN